MYTRADNADIRNMYDSACSCDLSESDTNDSQNPKRAQALGAEALYDGQPSGETKSYNDIVSATDPSTDEASSQSRTLRVGAKALTVSARRSKQFHKQMESSEAPEKGSLTPSMRKKYLKDLFLNHNSHTGLSTILSLQSGSQSSKDCEDEAKTIWVLDPTEHMWMLSVVGGSYDTIMEFLSKDPGLLTKKDFISGYTALHWLAKNGSHEILIKLLRRAEKEGYPVNVNLKGSGGLTPLHVAAMHSQYMVIKILVGAFSADVNTMDYNGKRAWQYLKDAPPEMKELLGAWDDEYLYSHWQLNANNNCIHGTEATPAAELQKDTKMAVPSQKAESWWRSSFKKLLHPFILGEKT